MVLIDAAYRLSAERAEAHRLDHVPRLAAVHSPSISPDLTNIQLNFRSFYTPLPPSCKKVATLDRPHSIAKLSMASLSVASRSILPLGLSCKSFCRRFLWSTLASSLNPSPQAPPRRSSSHSTAETSVACTGPTRSTLRRLWLPRASRPTSSHSHGAQPHHHAARRSRTIAPSSALQLHPPPLSPRNPRILMILPSPIIDVLYFSPAGVDPLLLALERESRIGVRTQCARCRVHGRSFPSCSRTADSYCSRECRVEMKDTRG